MEKVVNGDSQGYNVYVIQSGRELNSEFIRGRESFEYYILLLRCENIIINIYLYVTNINILCLFVVFRCVDFVVILVVVPTTCVVRRGLSY